MSNAASPGPVVVGVDGSDAATRAAVWAVKEAVHYDVPLRLVYVNTITDPPLRSVDARPTGEEHAENCLRAAYSASEATGLPVKIETQVRRGDVDSVLITESSGATLICVGSVGIGRMANIVLGSTAALLAEEAYCPVAIIRAGPQSPAADVGFIAVVVDNHDGNEEVVRWAMEEARVRQAPVLALGVWRWTLFDNNHESFYTRLDHWLRRYPDVQVEIATTRSTVTRYLESFVGAVQLVVVGMEDADRVVALIGPRGVPILAHADCSVLVVRDIDD
jgi:nucleotide-binding universal stress UspA family protein